MTKKKKSSLLKKKNILLTKGKLFKGAIDAGTVYGVLLLAIVLGGAYLMLGNISPNIASPDEGQQVIPKNATDTSNHSNLQLKDFAAITLTPTPTPTATPTPIPTTPPPDTSGGHSSSCFVKGTKILMSNNTQKNIEDVKAGNKVMGYDGKKLVAETVLQMESPIRNDYYELKLADGTIVGVTDEHPLYTQTGWKSINPTHTAQENLNLHVTALTVGDNVLKSSKQYVAVISITHKEGPIQVYNLKRVQGFNDFFANGILAHNKGGGGPSGGSSL